MYGCVDIRENKYNKAKPLMDVDKWNYSFIWILLNSYYFSHYLGSENLEIFEIHVCWIRYPISRI